MADVLNSAEFYAKLLVTETIDVGIDGVTNQAHVHEIDNVSGSLKPTTTVPATKVFKDEGALAAGVATIDFTALVRPNLPDVDLTGLKVQLIIITNKSTSNALRVKVGAADPYDLFGDANGEVTILKTNADGKPGFIMWNGNEELENVDGTHKDIDLSSGDATCPYDILVVGG